MNTVVLIIIIVLKIFAILITGIVIAAIGIIWATLIDVIANCVKVIERVSLVVAHKESCE